VAELPKHGRRFADVSGKSQTVQAEKDKTDINQLMGKHLQQRMQGNPNGRQPIYGAVPSATYHEMMNSIVSMDTQFNRLPANIRKRFMNRPEVMLRFLEDPNNRRECVELGMIDDPQMLEQIQAEARAKARKKAQAVQTDLTDPQDDGETSEAQAALEADEEANPRKGVKKTAKR